jgi:hypothetical protein
VLFRGCRWETKCHHIVLVAAGGQNDQAPLSDIIPFAYPSYESPEPSLSFLNDLEVIFPVAGKPVSRI